MSPKNKKLTEKVALLNEAKSLGIPATQKWTVDRLRREIEAKKNPPPSLTQKATALGLVVPEEWADDQIQEAITAAEEAAGDEAVQAVPVQSDEPLEPRRKYSPRG